MNVIFFGTPKVAIHVLRALAEGGHNIAGIITQPGKNTNNTRKNEESQIQTFATQNRIPCLRPASLSSTVTRQSIQDLGGEIAVVAAYGKIIPKTILDIWEKGCVCIHPSLLPKHRGASPVQETILKGETLTGTTVFLTNERMDAGPVLSQNQFLMSEKDTGESLLEKLFLLGGQMICPALESYANGTLVPVPQVHSDATFTRLLKKTDGEINWKEEPEAICRRVRAYIPWPGTFTFWNGKRLSIMGAMPINHPSDSIPGKIINFDDKTKMLIIAAGKSKLGISHLKIEGKREITAAEFLRGYPSFLGDILPS